MRNITFICDVINAKRISGLKIPLFVLFGICAVVTDGHAQYVFAINDFEATREKLNVVGDAAYYEGRMRITPASTNRQGAGWYKDRQIDLSLGFETEFVFLISETSSEPGDGFAFVMQNQSPTAIGGLGDAIGYKKIPYVMAIEFDTRDNAEGSKNHINLSFYDPAEGSYRRYATVHEIPEITDGNEHFTRIVYQNRELQVFLDSYLFPVLSVRIDIAERINANEDKAWMGFTGSTSDAYGNHDLLEWNLREFAAQPADIAEAEIEVIEAHTIRVKSRKLRIRVWDHNTIDGDIISLKWGDNWLLSNYELTGEEYEMELLLDGFRKNLTLYANNVGLVPPNTAMVTVFDGNTTHRIELNADFEQSESLLIEYRNDTD